MSYEFDAVKAKDDCIQWIRDWFNENGKGCNAVIGISGGKDSTIVAALLVEALGKDSVIGVQMPNGVQSDIDVSNEVIDYIGIRSYVVNIKEAYDSIFKQVDDQIEGISEQSSINLSPRLRMSALYAVSQSVNGRVVNTCNYSEDYVGYSTRYGDSVGDFSPLSDFTVTEVKAIGRVLGVPDKFIDKVPSDGLCGKSDEANLGFTYETLDKYIREGIEPADSIKYSIDNKHKWNLFKLQLMPMFKQSKTCEFGKEVVR